MDIEEKQQNYKWTKGKPLYIEELFFAKQIYGFINTKHVGIPQYTGATRGKRMQGTCLCVSAKRHPDPSV